MKKTTLDPVSELTTSGYDSDPCDQSLLDEFIASGLYKQVQTPRDMYYIPHSQGNSSHEEKSSTGNSTGQPYANAKGYIEFSPDYTSEDAINHAKQIYCALHPSITKSNKKAGVIDYNTLIEIAGRTSWDQRRSIRTQYEILFCRE